MQSTKFVSARRRNQHASRVRSPGRRLRFRVNLDAFRGELFPFSSPAADSTVRSLRATKIRLLLFFVAEKTTLTDDLRHLRWHHFIPGLIAAGDALEHITRKARQI